MQLFSQVIDFAKKASGLVAWMDGLEKRANPLVISGVRIGGIEPERIATEVEISPNLLTSNEADAVSPRYYLQSSEQAGWAGECVIRFRLENQSDKRVSIRGIYVDRRKLTVGPKGSMLFIPQGNTIGGPCRFACYLDSDNSASMALLDSWSCDGRRVIPQNYFEEGSLELAPGGLINVALHLRTEDGSFECGGISLMWEMGPGPRFELAVPLPRRVFVYALNQIPEGQRFRRTYGLDEPWIALEGGPRFSNGHPYSWY